MNERPAGKQIALTAIAILVLGCLIYVLYGVIAADVADDRKTAESDRQLSENLNENLEQIRSLNEKEDSRVEDSSSSETDDLSAKAQQPNTIYVKTVDGELTLENLIALELKQEEESTSDEGSGRWGVFGQQVMRISSQSDDESWGDFAVSSAAMVLDDDLLGQYQGALWQAFTQKTWGAGDNGRPENILLNTEQLNEIRQRGFVVVAFKVNFKRSDTSIKDAKEYLTAASKDEELVGHHIPEEFADLDERKVFIEKLSLGEAGECGGWHYLKLKTTLPE